MVTLLKRLHNVLIQSISEEDYKHILDEIREANRRALAIYSTICAFFMFALVVISYVLTDFSSFRWLYVGSSIALFLISFSAWKLLPGKLILVEPAIVFFIIILNTFGICLGTIMTPGRVMVSFIAILILEMIPFADAKYRLKGVLLLSMIVCTWITLKVKDKTVIQTDIVDIWVYGLIGLLGGIYTSRLRILTILQTYKVRIISENDLLTNLKNRNSYEKQLRAYAGARASSIACIYVDVNGLHNLNNTRGHQEGDRMLKFIAMHMQRMFGNEHTYRIGGDEFVAFSLDSEMHDVNKQISTLKQIVEAAEYHISVGCERIDVDPLKRTDMDVLIKTAEKRMYQEKERYYAECNYKRV